MYAPVTLTTPGLLPDYLTGLDQAHLAGLSWCDGYPELSGAVGPWVFAY